MTTCADCGGHLTLETRGEIETIFATCHRGVPVHRGIRDGWFTACDRCDAVVEVVSGRVGQVQMSDGRRRKGPSA